MLGARFGTVNSLLAKECRGSVRPTVGFDEGIVAQNGDPGIPMAAGRLFAECGRELIGIHEVLALGGQGAQHFKGRGRQAATHHKESRAAGVEGTGGTSPAGLRPSAVAVTRASLSAT